jgi:ribosomal 50S subunit-recycling heat shock protein
LARHRSRVSEAQAGKRLDAVVASVPGVGTRSLAERLVTAGAVLVDGERRPKSHRLEGGEELEVDVPEPGSREPPGGQQPRG